jgi:hypothetical protein
VERDGYLHFDRMLKPKCVLRMVFMDGFSFQHGTQLNDTCQ